MKNWNRDQRKSKVDESSSKSNSVLGREEGFGSVPFTRGPNFEEGSSSSHSHVNNNLQEHERLMMLRSQGTPRPPAFNQHVNHMNNLEEQQRHMQRMPRTQHTDPNSSSNTVNARVYRPGSRFLPTHLGCVRVHLRNKVEKNKSGFITTLDLYKDDPWLLDHVHNNLFPRGEWYYFTPRNKRGISSCIRSVRGRGGGTWRSTTKKEPIFDKDKKVQGYFQNLVYNKTDVNGETKPTGWNMTEYCLHEKNQDDLVLCHIKGNLKKKEFVEEVKSNILSNQVQDHEEEEAGDNGVELRKLEEHHGDATQQQQEQDAPPIPVLEGQGLGVETMMTTTTQNNDHNSMTMLQEDHGDATQQQQQPQEQYAPPVLVPPPLHESHELGFETMITMRDDDHGDAATQKQQEQYAPQVQSRSSHEGQDSRFWTLMSPLNNDHYMPMLDENQQYQSDDLDLFSLHYDLQPFSHAQDAVGGSSTQNKENNFMPMLDENQQYQSDDLDLFSLHYDLQQPFSHAQDAMGGSSTQNKENNFIQEDHGEATQQQQEQDALQALVLPPHEGQDTVLEAMMNDENNFIPMRDEDQHQWDDSQLHFSIDELFKVKDNVNEGTFTTTGF